MSKFRILPIIACLSATVIAVPSGAQSLLEGQQLLEAVRKSDGNAVMSLMASNPTLVNTRSYDGDTPLLISVSKGKDDWASFFIGKGADVNSANRDGETPLIVATRNGSEQVVNLLLASKARVDQANKIGETPLIVAVQLRNVKLAKQLVVAGADPDKTDYSGHSARDYAKRDDRDPRMQRLFDAPTPSN